MDNIIIVIDVVKPLQTASVYVFEFHRFSPI